MDAKTRAESEAAGYEDGVYSYDRLVTRHHSPHQYVVEHRKRLDRFLATGNALYPAEMEAWKKKKEGEEKKARAELV